MTDTLKSLYIVGPTADELADRMTALLVGDRRTDASAVVVAADDRGWDPVCPQIMPVPLPPTGDPAIGPDTAVLLSCDAVLLLGGWEYSGRARSACIDAAVAGLPIFDYRADGIPYPNDDAVCRMPIRPVFDARFVPWNVFVDRINRRRADAGRDRVRVRYLED